MPVPDFIVDLRTRIGHDLLWLPSVTAVVLRDATDDSVWSAPEVLLVKRADNGKWTPITGISEPGEEPQDAAVREVAEETGLRSQVEALLGVGATEPVTHVNGDQAVYQFTALRLSVVGDDIPRIGDDESSDVGWFSITTMPVKDPVQRLIVADAVAQRKFPDSFTPRLGFRTRR